jgi:hypothetical protein
MNFRTVDQVKQRIVAAARLAEDFPRAKDDPPFAIGIGYTEREDDYRLAVRVDTQENLSVVLGRYERFWRDARVDADLRVIGRATMQLAVESGEEERDQPLAIGDSISHFQDRSGTLGFFAERKGVKGLVSCNHVVARLDGAAVDDPILSPGTSDDGKDPQDRAGRLVYSVGLRGGGRKRADCAFVEVDPKRFPKNPGIIGSDGDLQFKAIFIRQFLPVIKIGRTSKRTEGRITAGNLDHFEADYPMLTVKFNDVYEVETTDRSREPKAFCREGDSGSLVYSRNREPIGLLFYKKPSGGPGNSGLGYLNPLLNVLKALDAKLLV